VRITVNTDGSVTLEVQPGDDETQIMKVAGVWGAQASRQTPSIPALRPKVVGTFDFTKRPAGVFTGTEHLNQKFYDTWACLVDHDRPDGIHLSAVARALSISDMAAGTRLARLTQRGYATRVSKGCYRAVDPNAGVVPNKVGDETPAPVGLARERT